MVYQCIIYATDGLIPTTVDKLSSSVYKIQVIGNKVDKLFRSKFFPLQSLMFMFLWVYTTTVEVEKGHELTIMPDSRDVVCVIQRNILF